jgi:hypothetical protein
MRSNKGFGTPRLKQRGLERTKQHGMWQSLHQDTARRTPRMLLPAMPESKPDRSPPGLERPWPQAMLHLSHKSME